MITLATWSLAVPLFTLYCLAYRAHVREDDKAAWRFRALTTPFWMAAAIGQGIQGEDLLAVVNIGMMLTGVWAWATYLTWGLEEAVEASVEAAIRTHERRPDVLDSHRGGGE